MKKRMIIDAAHQEEIRIVVSDDNIIEELDHETSTKNQVKGNIYLAKVMRVEPSLRAAFVDYGNTKHGFLSFNEIHPNYFQIPVSDKEKLLKDNGFPNDSNKIEENKESTNNQNQEKITQDDEIGDLITPEIDTIDNSDKELNDKKASIRRSRLYSKYKIQEVIKKRQILLVQVVKEERGNKGAALTTFISLAGRYCVLMPNSSNAGGISRKISFNLRKKMKDVLDKLAIPKEMSVILRTAGSERTKLEIKRDFNYLLRLWNQIRNTTLKSLAPILVHEENHIIKRAIRDHYIPDIKEVFIEGDDAYKLAKSYMKTLLPSKANVIKKYNLKKPIFSNYDIEKKLEIIHGPEVILKSGGSIIISPTEALVAIDVNSGKSTKERDIEATALKTNVEAAVEIARQLKLRDLAGLIVIDFIDMNRRRNNYTVENTLKNSIRSDRARIQIGRISPFGLLEMSRQRLGPSLIEKNYKICNSCLGTGTVRSTESQTLSILRSVEEFASQQKSLKIFLELNPQVAEYIFNYKRNFITNIEKTRNFELKIISNNLYKENQFSIIADEKKVFSSFNEDTSKKIEEIGREKANNKIKPIKKTNKPKSKSNTKRNVVKRKYDDDFDGVKPQNISSINIQTANTKIRYKSNKKSKDEEIKETNDQKKKNTGTARNSRKVLNKKVDSSKTYTNNKNIKSKKVKSKIENNASNDESKKEVTTIQRIPRKSKKIKINSANEKQKDKSNEKSTDKKSKRAGWWQKNIS